MAQQAALPRVPDGYRDKLLALAERLTDGAGEQREARYDRQCQQTAMRHASMDAEKTMLAVADELRRLRR